MWPFVVTLQLSPATAAEPDRTVLIGCPVVGRPTCVRRKSIESIIAGRNEENRMWVAMELRDRIGVRCAGGHRVRDVVAPLSDVLQAGPRGLPARWTLVSQPDGRPMDGRRCSTGSPISARSSPHGGRRAWTPLDGAPAAARRPQPPGPRLPRRDRLCHLDETWKLGNSLGHR